MARDALTTRVQIGPSFLRRLLPVGLLGGALVMVFWLWPEHWLTFDFPRGKPERLAERFAAYPRQTALAFCLLYGVCAVLPLPWAWLLSIAAGAIFGLAWGFPLVLGSLALLGVFPLLAKRALEAEAWRGHRASECAPRIDRDAMIGNESLPYPELA